MYNRWRSIYTVYINLQHKNPTLYDLILKKNKYINPCLNHKPKTMDTLCKLANKVKHLTKES